VRVWLSLTAFSQNAHVQYTVFFAVLGRLFLFDAIAIIHLAVL
jgi:hypothetical protein